MKIPFLSFKQMNAVIKPEVMAAFEHFFDSNWYILGDRVQQFENEYAQFNHVAYCVGVSNGLDALHIALKTLGIGKGDEVLVPSNTYIATVLAISFVGATPVFVEPDISTYNIDPSKIEEKISSKTKAILPVHLYGQCADMKAILQIAKKHNLYVIEDNAQSQGSMCDGKLAGSFGDMNATSFYPGKNLGALGDAGAITTDNKQLAELSATIRNYGSSRKYFNEVIGMNARLDECQASILSVKLKYLPGWNEERVRIAGWYAEQLKSLDNVVLPALAAECTSVYHLYVIRSSQRNSLQQYLTENGIGTLIHYPVPPHLQKAYADLNYKRGDFPIAEKIADTCLSLPIFIGMSFEEVSYVCDTIKNFISIRPGICLRSVLSYHAISMN